MNNLFEPSGDLNKNQSLESPSVNGDMDKMLMDWCFIDCCTAERVFRVDSGQEHLHYITDISTDDLYILDPTMSQELEPLGYCVTAV